MVTSLGTLESLPNPAARPPRQSPPAPKQPGKNPVKDILQLGAGKTPDKQETGNIVLERALNQLRAVVDEARAELGLGPNDKLDTSEEATAGRIADFALKFFGRYAENNGLADDEEGRAQFAGFIGDAIEQGIQEAEGILAALNVTSESSGFDINKTRSLIQERLDNFVANGL